MPDLTEELIAARAPGRRQPRSSPPGLDEDALRATMRAALAERPEGGPLRLFSYGALMWERGAVPGAAAAPAALPGFARAWCLRDIHTRGTPEAPGLTLGITAQAGARCEGVLFTLDRRNEEAALWSAWQQEMTPGFYRPVWVRVQPLPAGEALPALAFLTRDAHPLRTPALPEEEVARILASASGPGGPAADYLHRAAEALRRHGMRDAALERIAAKVAGRLADAAAPRREAQEPLP
jgi:cation transport protein ChaC